MGSLININFFIYRGLFNYFVLTISSGVILTTVLFWKYRTIKNMVNTPVTLPSVLFLLWALFVFVQLGEAVQYKYYRIAVCFSFIISFIVLKKNNAISFYKSVAIIATIEGLWCILQYLGKIPSESNDFAVTGSFVNPNVVAMFLALCLPALLYFCFKASSAYLKAVHYLTLLIVFIGLLLLECRTAILGGAFSSGLFIVLRFNLIKRYKRKYLLLAILAIVILIVPVGRQLYLHKKDSADGRLLIWRISTQMILDSPVRGYGTGMFEREYNLQQAKVIQKKKLSGSELKKASFVLMAYNDYLEQAVEGGFPALLFFVTMIVSFLYPSKINTNIRLENNTNDNLDITYVAYAGFASFALMAFFNFILQAVPAMLLFCVYAGILCINDEQRKLTDLSIKQPVAKTILLALTCFTFYLTFGQLIQAKEYRKIKIARDFLESGNISQAESLLVPLQNSKQNSTSFCIIYGNLLYSQNKYNEALEQFETAKKFSSSAILFKMAAQCQFQLKNNKEAISNLYQLTLLSPKTMKYKFDLMQILTSNKQINLACIVAQQIIDMNVVNPNELTDKYQSIAKLLLKKSKNSNSNKSF